MTTETITFEEVGMLLGLAAARDQRTTGDADVLAWHSDLNAAGVTFASASAALSRFYVDQASLPVDQRYRATSPDIIGLARKLRSERLENFVYEPPPGDSDPDYLTRRRAQLAAAGDGIRPADPEREALDARPRPVAALMPGVGREVPDEDGNVRGALGVTCPKCGAEKLRACKTPNGRRMHVLHPSRIAAANTSTASAPVNEAAEQEIERRKAAARAALAALPPGSVVEPQDGFEMPPRGEVS